jgi:hypothetical protein
MELFLWLYFYDSRWLFNLKVPVRIYKYIWIIPFMIHFIFLMITFYYFDKSNNPTCQLTTKLWLYHRLLYSILISINIIIFMIKIQIEYRKEKNALLKASQVYPALKNKIYENDYWIRRNSLISTPGITLLFLSIVSLFWTYLIIGIQNKKIYESCDVKLQNIVDIQTYVFCYSNLILCSIFSTMVIIKLTALFMDNLFPNLSVKLWNLVKLRKSVFKRHYKEKNN